MTATPRDVTEVGITRIGKADRDGARATSELTKSEFDKPLLDLLGRKGDTVTATRSAIAEATRMQWLMKLSRSIGTLFPRMTSLYINYLTVNPVNVKTLESMTLLRSNTVVMLAVLGTTWP